VSKRQWNQKAGIKRQWTPPLAEQTAVSRRKPGLGNAVDGVVALAERLELLGFERLRCHGC